MFSFVLVPVIKFYKSMQACYLFSFVPGEENKKVEISVLK